MSIAVKPFFAEWNFEVWEEFQFKVGKKEFNMLLKTICEVEQNGDNPSYDSIPKELHLNLLRNNKAREHLHVVWFLKTDPAEVLYLQHKSITAWR